MAGTIARSKIQHRFIHLYPYLLFIFAGYCIADLAILSTRPLMLPNQAPPTRPAKSRTEDLLSRGAYNTIISRNIFSADGTIPDPLVGKDQSGRPKPGQEAPPVPSQLPLSLVGTIVHSNPEKSIANIEVKGKNQVFAFSPKRDIDNIASIIKVERNKVILRNLNNNRLEYIENKQQSKISFSADKAKLALPGESGEVRAIGENKYELNRADVLKYTADMSTVLMQASTMPRKKPNGEIDGFILTSFQPGSIYSQLGFLSGDVIKAVNGEPVDSPAKALELYNALKTSSNIKITVERDGRDTTKDYTIK